MFQRVFWGVKIRFSKFGFKTGVENPRIEKLNFWFTLTGLLIARKSEKNNNQTRLIDWQQKEYFGIFQFSCHVGEYLQKTAPTSNLMAMKLVNAG